MTLEMRIAALAARQMGVFSRWQLLEIGMTARQISTRLGTGEWVQIHRRIYALAAALPLSWKARCIAAQLSLGDCGALSHRGAGAYWNLAGVPEGFVEFSTSKGRGPKAVKVHVATMLGSADLRRMSLLNVTKVERTLVDLGSVLPEVRVEEAFESALVQRLTTFERVASYAAGLRGPGVRGSRAVGRILDRRDPSLAATESVFETRFWRLLCRSRLPRSVRQFKIFDLEGFVARLDLAWPFAKVGVEAYSRRHHREMFDQIQRDTRRHNRLTAMGWHVFYESYDVLNQGAEEMLQRLEGVLLPRLLED
jgi:very-short-patch-repair endonuclease